MKKILFKIISLMSMTTALGQSYGHEGIQFGTDLKATNVVRRAKILARELTESKDSNWRAGGDQHRTYYFNEVKESFPYRICVPDAWDGVSPLPMVVFLHGGWNTENSYLDQNDKQLVKIANQYGVLLVSPLGGHGAYGNYMHFPAKFDAQSELDQLLSELQPDCIKEQNISEQDVINVIERVLAEYPVNRKAMFLMGHSMGSGGTWYLGAKYHQYWRALLPISGPFTMSKGYPWRKLRNRPILMTEGLRADASLESSRQLYHFAKNEKRLNITYKEVDGNHGGMFPMILDDCFQFIQNIINNK